MSNAIPNAPITPPARGATGQKESPTVNFLTHMMFAGGTAFATSLMYAATYPIALMMKTDRGFFSYMSGTAAKCVALAGAGLGTYISVTGVQANREFMAARAGLIGDIQQKLAADLQLPEVEAKQKAEQFADRFFEEAAKNPNMPQEMIGMRVQQIYGQMFGALYDQRASTQMETALATELNLSPEQAKQHAAQLQRFILEEASRNPSITPQAMEAKVRTQFASLFKSQAAPATTMASTPIEQHAAPTTAATPEPETAKLSATAHQGQVATVAEKALA